jgi:RNA polymerase sigma-70 factor, ECF subfamily
MQREHKQQHDGLLEADFEQIVSQYDVLIRKVCFFYASDLDDFNDLRQEALVNLWRGFPKFRGDAKITTWIYRVCLNSCVSYFRTHKKSKNAVPIEQAAQLIADTDEKAEMLREMYRLINSLNSSDKALIMLWLDEYSYDEIAQIIGQPRNTVATRLHRIKGRLVSMGQDSCGSQLKSINI